VNQNNTRFCYYAFGKSWALATDGAWIGSGVTQAVDFGWRPDVLMTITTSSFTEYNQIKTSDMPTTTSCAYLQATGVTSCGTGLLTFSDTGFVASGDLVLGGKTYYFFAAKKNAEVSNWLWTSTWSGVGREPQAINVGGMARMAMITSDAKTAYLCRGLRHNQSDLATNPYLQGNTDLIQRGLTLSTDPNGFVAEGPCNAPTAGYYAWGLRGLPTITPAATPTPTCPAGGLYTQRAKPTYCRNTTGGYCLGHPEYAQESDNVYAPHGEATPGVIVVNPNGGNGCYMRCSGFDLTPIPTEATGIKLTGRVEVRAIPATPGTKWVWDNHARFVAPGITPVPVGSDLSDYQDVQHSVDPADDEIIEYVSDYPWTPDLVNSVDTGFTWNMMRSAGAGVGVDQMSLDCEYCGATRTPTPTITPTPVPETPCAELDGGELRGGFFCGQVATRTRTVAPTRTHYYQAPG
jgi:hypothetical protein